MEIAVAVVLSELILKKAVHLVYVKHHISLWTMTIIIAVLATGLLVMVFEKIWLLPVLLLN